MIIHQIFFKVGDKTFDDYPCYVVGMSKWKQLCEEQGWEHKLHTKPDTSIMTEEEINIMEEGDKRYPFFRIDYYRYILLSHYGGMYVDLDVEPTDDFKLIMNDELIVVSGNRENRGDIGPTQINCVGNDVMKLPHDLALELKEYTHIQFYEKCNIEVYKTWRKRFLLRTVGPSMMTKFCKSKKICITDFDKYFKDHATMSWENF